MTTFVRSTQRVLTALICVSACQRGDGATAPMAGPEVLVMSLSLTPDSLAIDDPITIAMRADNPTALSIRLDASPCPEDLLVLSVIESSGALTPTVSGIPCKLRPTNEVLPPGGMIAKNLQISARALLGVRPAGSYRIRLDYWTGTKRITGPSQWVAIR